MIEEPRKTLELMVALAHPEYLGMTLEYVSEYCYTIIVLDSDYTYNEWRAHLSEDDRWTLSPVRLVRDNGDAH